MSEPKHVRIRNSTAEFLVFTAQAGEKGIEVRVEEQTVWLTQKLIAALFDVDVRTVNEHLKNIVLFNNLASIPATTFQCPEDADGKAALALKLDLAIRERAPAGWKSDAEGPRGAQVLNALFPLLGKDRAATKALFDIIKEQPGY